jgi:protein TonB
VNLGERKPNWLLRGLIGLSLCIHLLLFLHVYGVYTPKALSYIELTIQDPSRPFSRSIPRPRAKPKTLPDQQIPEKVETVRPLIPRPETPKTQPSERAEPESLVEAIPMPDVPATPKLDVTHWNPADLTQNVSDYRKPSNYFDMVRFQVERHKQYPDSARLRQIEGHVVIRFVITPEGAVRTLRVAKPSGSLDLDEAALRAVRDAAPFPKPPARLFGREVSLELTMVFELT